MQSLIGIMSCVKSKLEEALDLDIKIKIKFVTGRTIVRYLVKFHHQLFLSQDLQTFHRILQMSLCSCPDSNPTHLSVLGDAAVSSDFSESVFSPPELSPKVDIPYQLQVSVRFQHLKGIYLADGQQELNMNLRD